MFYHSRNGHITRVHLLARVNLLLPSINRQQEVLRPLLSLASRSKGPREKMRMRLGDNAESSHPLRYLQLWSELVVAVRRKNVGWRRRDERPALRS